MTDKVQKIREKVEKLKSQLLRGACSSQVAMETHCKEEAYNEVLSILDTMQEEPVSIWHDASEKPNFKEKGSIFVITSLNGEYIGSRYYNYNDITINFGNYDKWAYLNDLVNLSNVQRIGKNWKEEPVSEDLEEVLAREWQGYNDRGAATVDALEDNTQELAFAKGFYRGTKWQKEQMLNQSVNGKVIARFPLASEPLYDDVEIYLNFTKGLSEGDKVKVIIIKED